MIDQDQGMAVDSAGDPWDLSGASAPRPRDPRMRRMGKPDPTPCPRDGTITLDEYRAWCADGTLPAGCRPRGGPVQTG